VNCRSSALIDGANPDGGAYSAERVVERLFAPGRPVVEPLEFAALLADSDGGVEEEGGDQRCSNDPRGVSERAVPVQIARHEVDEDDRGDADDRRQ